MLTTDYAALKASINADPTLSVLPNTADAAFQIATVAKRFDLELELL